MILGVDVGGTFTDAVLLTADAIVTGKAPTVPEDQSRGVMNAVEQALDHAGATANDVDRLVHGMTIATNALLEGRTAKTALIATEGFVDLEELRRQARPDLYRLCAGHPPPLVEARRRVAAPERIGPEGVLRPLEHDVLRDRLDELEDDVEAVAICLLWGFRSPEHELAAAELVSQALPDAHVSTSHETAAVFREYERLATTVVDAALSPLLRRYLRRLTDRAREAGLPRPEVMLSGGGVADAETAAQHGSWTVLSGPAGGAVGAAHAAREAGAADAVALDMGGTSCDVSLISDGRVAVSGSRSVGGHCLALPTVDVHTVGAGGGSIAWCDEGGALRVGPRSAGAEPGPACYGRGGGLPTVTDANVVLGNLAPDAPLAGGVELDVDAARRALETLCEPTGLPIERIASGIVHVVDVEMARAVRAVTVERGVDPRALVMVAFGGAGPLHAARIADQLEMRTVVIPAASGVLSAFGLAISERRRDLQESALLSGEQLTRTKVAAVVQRLAARGRDELGAPAAKLHASFDLRYAGQAFELTVPGEPAPEPVALRSAFDAAHDERYGYTDPDAPLELVTVRVAVATPSSEPPAGHTGPGTQRVARTVRFGNELLQTSVHDGGEAAITGPAIVELTGSTLVVPPGWSGTVDAAGVVIRR